MLHDRIIGALELLCRRGEMLLIQNKRVYWDTYQIGIPGATAKDQENRRVPFDPDGRLARTLEHRSALGPEAFVFGTEDGRYQSQIQTAWETLRLLAYGYEPRKGDEGARWNREQLDTIDLHWHDLRNEGASRLLANGVDIRVIQLMLGHASLEQTQRYLNVTDEELRRGLQVSWQRARIVDSRPTVSGRPALPFATRSDSGASGEEVLHDCPQIVPKAPSAWPSEREVAHHSVRPKAEQLFEEIDLKGLGCGAPGRIRTCDLWLRRPTLYPAELRARAG